VVRGWSKRMATIGRLKPGWYGVFHDLGGEGQLWGLWLILP